MKHSLIALLGLPSAAIAQPFTLEWSTIDSGGAINLTAGAYTLGASIGQPDAGTLTAAPYECQGGFWNTDQATPPGCYANCDGSTGTPALTANDFQCFINKYAGGCT